MHTVLHWHNYRYFPYERELARREVQALINPDIISECPEGLIIEGDISASQKEEIRRLVYFSGLSFNGLFVKTLQKRLESSCTASGTQKRQSTRYSVHGLHEYKGKFNPQVVRGILNALGVKPDSCVLDPFCGSGTTLVECAHGNLKAVGCDLNPLAVFISNAKLLALSTPAVLLEKHLKAILKTCVEMEGNQPAPQASPDKERAKYLCSWFCAEIYDVIERLRSAIIDEGSLYKNIFFVLVSDLLRDYSLQEPADLRIRRRKSALPNIPFLKAFQAKSQTFLQNLSSAQAVGGKTEMGNSAYLADIRTIGYKPYEWEIAPPYDAAVTSPPYATALPYIDTQRLSLIWIGLASKDKLKELEAGLTGSRELYNEDKFEMEIAFQQNLRSLCPSVYLFCQTLKNSIGEGDGFRRQAVPHLMYRYFSDMQDMFVNVLSVMRPKAPFALVIGHNRTTLDGRLFDINTPELLKELAVHSGWTHEESLPLQTYHRYSIHSKNAVSLETLLILRKP